MNPQISDSSRVPRASAPADETVEHRRHVRDLLARVRGIVQRSAVYATPTQEYAAHLMGRLDALARVQEILMRDRDERIDLGELVADEFLAQGVANASISVPTASLMLDRQVAASLALAMHELATNAIKFGQLHMPGRRITLRWDSVEDPPGWVALDWREAPLTGAEPEGLASGFGFELIRNTLPYETGARTRISMGPEGLHCRIAFCPAGVRE